MVVVLSLCTAAGRLTPWELFPSSTSWDHPLGDYLDKRSVFSNLVFLPVERLAAADLLFLPYRSARSAALAHFYVVTWSKVSEICWRISAGRRSKGEQIWLSFPLLRNTGQGIPLVRCAIKSQTHLAANFGLYIFIRLGWYAPSVLIALKRWNLRSYVNWSRRIVLLISFCRVWDVELKVDRY
jgi:hypothetical protein